MEHISFDTSFQLVLRGKPRHVRGVSNHNEKICVLQLGLQLNFSSNFEKQQYECHLLHTNPIRKIQVFVFRARTEISR